MYLLSQHKTFDPAFEFLSVASLLKPIGNMPPSSLRTTVKWLSIPGFFHSDANMGVSILKKNTTKAVLILVEITIF